MLGTVQMNFIEYEDGLLETSSITIFPWQGHLHSCHSCQVFVQMLCNKFWLWLFTLYSALHGEQTTSIFTKAFLSA